jgi:two-component system copper resistance phosphate regulon response regulator CusR
MTRILIVEDEERIASFLVKGFRAHGFATEVVMTGDEGLSRARSGDFGLVLLDIGLPDRDGFSVLAELRKHDTRLPVVILTARDNVADTVAGFDGGANDYVTKPFKFDELLARVRARLGDHERTPEETVLSVADAALDLRTRCVRVGDRDVELSAREFALAELFFRHPGQVLSREQILNNVWGYDFDPGSNIVDVYVGYLRKKLAPGAITSVRRMGYRLEKKPQV